MRRRRPDLRTAMLDLEGAVVELHAAEECAAGRSERSADLALAAERYSRARGVITACETLKPEEKQRATALLDTVGLLLAVRQALGEASLASRILS